MTTIFFKLKMKFWNTSYKKKKKKTLYKITSQANQICSHMKEEQSYQAGPHYRAEKEWQWLQDRTSYMHLGKERASVYPK